MEMRSVSGPIRCHPLQFNRLRRTSESPSKNGTVMAEAIGSIVTVPLGPCCPCLDRDQSLLDAQLDVTADQRDSDVLRGRMQSMRLRSGDAQVLEFP